MPARTKRVIPVEAPVSLPPLAGRNDDVHRLVKFLAAPADSARIAVITGPAGVGKTALALTAAQRLTRYFRDGQVWVTQRELPPSRGPRRLVIVDDWPDWEAVQAALSGSGARYAIVTSRLPVTQLQPSQLHLSLGPLSGDVALTVLDSLIGNGRVAEEPAAARVISATADGYPFALKVLGTMIASRRHWRLQVLARLVTPPPGQEPAGQEPPGGPDAPDVPARRAFDLIATLLTSEHRDALTRLGVLVTPSFEPRLLAGLMDIPDATQAVSELARIGLVERDPDAPTSRPVFVVTELTARYARWRLAALEPRLAGELEQRLHRETRQLTEVPAPRREIYRLFDEGRIEDAMNASRRAAAGPSIAVLAALHMELSNVDAEYLARRAIDLAAPEPCPTALRALGVLDRRLRLLEPARQKLTEALRATAQDPEADETIKILRELAIVEALDGRFAVARNAIQQGRQRCDADASGKSMLAGLVWAEGVVSATSGQLADAERQLLDCARLAGRCQQRLWVAWADFQRAEVLFQQDKLSHARDVAFRAMDHFTGMRHRSGTGRCWLLTGKLLLAEGRLPEAAAVIKEAIGTFRTCNDRWIEADARAALAQANREQRATGRR